MSQPLLLLHPVDEVFVDTIRSTSAWVPQTMHAHAHTHTHGDECTHADARLTDDAGTQHNWAGPSERQTCRSTRAHPAGTYNPVAFVMQVDAQDEPLIGAATSNSDGTVPCSWLLLTDSELDVKFDRRVHDCGMVPVSTLFDKLRYLYQ